MNTKEKPRQVEKRPPAPAPTKPLKQFLDEFVANNATLVQDWRDALPKFQEGTCYINFFGDRHKRYRLRMGSDVRFVSERVLARYLTNGDTDTLPASTCEAGCINPHHQRPIAPSLFKTCTNMRASA